MIYKKKVNNKLVVLEYVNSNSTILGTKQTPLKNKFKGVQYKEVTELLRKGELNTYIDITVIEEARVIYRFNELFFSNSQTELYEILLLLFKGKEQFEVCSLIRTLLDNI